MLDIDINKYLLIQVPLVNKWYTPKASTWDNITESRQRILTYIQNIKGSFSKLYNPLCTLYKKYSHKYYIYKQNSRPYFRGIYLRYCLSSKSCEKVYANSILLSCQLICIQDSLLRLKPVILQCKKRTQSASASSLAKMLIKKV